MPSGCQEIFKAHKDRSYKRDIKIFFHLGLTLIVDILMSLL